MKNRFLSSLTDRLILRPTKHPIQAAGKRHVLSYDDGHLEVWIQHRGANPASEPRLYVLEFPGTASRAERPHRFLDGCWSDAHVEIWSINPPGYGGSSGRASLRKFPAMACHAFDALQRVAQGHPVVVAGGSLGCVSALYLAAHRAVSGLLLQNPPALREVILARGSWWPVRWAARAIAPHVPADLDSLRNAALATVPAVFVIALRDLLVPAKIQQQVFEAYAGPKQVLERPNANHDTPISESELQELQRLKEWLHGAVESSRVR